MTSPLTAFNNQLCNLINNLSELYPNDTDISFTKTSIHLFKSSNPRKLQEIFNKYIYIYKEYIINKNEEFLLKTNFISINNLDGSEYANTIMTNLKKYWNEIDPESKENIWKYFKVLVILNEKCLE